MATPIAFCDRCDYQLESSRARCRYCGETGGLIPGEHNGDPGKRWFGFFKDEFKVMPEADKADHLENMSERVQIFEDHAHRFVYRPTKRQEREGEAIRAKRHKDGQLQKYQSRAESREYEACDRPRHDGHPMLPQPPLQEVVQSMTAHTRGMAQEKSWHGAVCTCGGAHPEELCGTHSEYLELWIDAFAHIANDGYCLICLQAGRPHLTHYTWQHGQGVFRDHPSNPTLPPSLQHLESPWPRAAMLLPLPYECYRQDGSELPVAERQLPDDLAGGLRAGLMRRWAKDEVKALQEGFDSGINTSRNIIQEEANERMRAIGALRQRYYRLKRTPVVEQESNQVREIVTHRDLLSGLPHDWRLRGTPFKAGQVAWFTPALMDTLLEVMTEEDEAELYRLWRFYRLRDTGSEDPSEVNELRHTVQLAWAIVATYVLFWRPDWRAEDYEKATGFAESMSKVRRNYRMWPSQHVQAASGLSTSDNPNHSRLSVIAEFQTGDSATTGTTSVHHMPRMDASTIDHDCAHALMTDATSQHQASLPIDLTRLPMSTPNIRLYLRDYCWTQREVGLGEDKLRSWSDWLATQISGLVMMLPDESLSRDDFQSCSYDLYCFATVAEHALKPLSSTFVRCRIWGVVGKLIGWRDSSKDDAIWWILSSLSIRRK